MTNKRRRLNYILIWVITTILIIITGVLIFLFVTFTSTVGKSEESTNYDRYYAMIADDSHSAFFNSVYEATLEAAAKENAYVELIGDNLAQDYSKIDLMKIAIASSVDGIIVVADESEEMTQVINLAEKSNIPVVTLYSDNSMTDRISYVGVGNYNLGREYGNLISDLCSGKLAANESLNVTILVDSNAVSAGQNLLLTAIQESVEKENSLHSYSHAPIEISFFSVDSSNSFSVEESLRSMFVGKEPKIPDIVVCLNEVTTTSMYQTVVEYNEVGKVNILGYYDSESILKGIERNVIHATVSIDTKQMGQFCIDALTEYYELGNTSQYFTADVSIITKDNLNEFRNGGEDEK